MHCAKIVAIILIQYQNCAITIITLEGETKYSVHDSVIDIDSTKEQL
jgi:hypothetical protein